MKTIEQAEREVIYTKATLARVEAELLRAKRYRVVGFREVDRVCDAETAYNEALYTLASLKVMAKAEAEGQDPILALLAM